jgi:hypothetical protein
LNVPFALNVAFQVFVEPGDTAMMMYFPTEGSQVNVGCTGKDTFGNFDQASHTGGLAPVHRIDHKVLSARRTTVRFVWAKVLAAMARMLRHIITDKRIFFMFLSSSCVWQCTRARKVTARRT